MSSESKFHNHLMFCVMLRCYWCILKVFTVAHTHTSPHTGWENCPLHCNTGGRWGYCEAVAWGKGWPRSTGWGSYIPKGMIILNNLHEEPLVLRRNQRTQLTLLTPSLLRAWFGSIGDIPVRCRHHSCELYYANRAVAMRFEVVRLQ